GGGDGEVAGRPGGGLREAPQRHGRARNGAGAPARPGRREAGRAPRLPRLRRRRGRACQCPLHLPRPARLLRRGSGAGRQLRRRGGELRHDPAEPPRAVTVMRLYYLTDEQRMVQELARSLAREKIAPVAPHHDETETYPEDLMRLLAQQGLMGIWVPE